MNLRLWGVLILLCGVATAQPPSSSGSGALVVDGNALFKSWTAPVLPEGMKAPAKGLRLGALVVVGADGMPMSAHLTERADPALEAAFEAAAKAWRFTPAMTDGKGYASVVQFSVPFVAANAAPKAPRPKQPVLRTVPTKPPHVEITTDAAYPDELNSRKLAGMVQFVCDVDAEGHPGTFVATFATHVAFVGPAEACVKQWKVEPARAGSVALPGQFQGEVDFRNDAPNNAAVLAANAITAPDGSEPEAVPQIDEAPEPVYPFDRLMAGESGEAVVAFTVLGSGTIDALTLKSASKPDFGAALLAAVQTWRFRPATQNGQGVDVPLMMKWTFLAPVGDNVDKLDSDFVAAVGAVKAGKVDPANHLSSPLRPLFRRPPAYPGSLTGDARTDGAAVVEVIITPDGRMRLPKVISASKPEFGWAAATSLQQWCFDPPVREGKPATIRIQVPFHFPIPQ